MLPDGTHGRQATPQSCSPLIAAPNLALRQEKAELWWGLASHHRLPCPHRSQGPGLQHRSLRPRHFSPRRAFISAYRARVAVHERFWDESVDLLRGQSGNSVVAFRALLGRHAREELIDVNFRTPWSWSVLHLAASLNRSRVVRYLVKDQGADVTARTPDGATVLVKAAIHGDLAYLQARALPSIEGTDPQRMPREPVDAAAWAAFNRHGKVVAAIEAKKKQLLQEGRVSGEAMP
jgi:ankyrin repeat protein